MTQHELVNKMSEIIDDTQTGVLATVDADGHPHVRWMTPAVLRDRQNALFALTCPDFSKAQHLKANPKVEWMFQSKRYESVVHVAGVVNVIDTPSLRNEVLEVLGPRLDMFWKTNCSSSDYVVLETVIEEATYYTPLSNVLQRVKFH